MANLGGILLGHPVAPGDTVEAGLDGEDSRVYSPKEAEKHVESAFQASSPELPMLLVKTRFLA